jgi:hypothetical protein
VGGPATTRIAGGGSRSSHDSLPPPLTHTRLLARSLIRNTRSLNNQYFLYVSVSLPVCESLSRLSVPAPVSDYLISIIARPTSPPSPLRLHLPIEKAESEISTTRYPPLFPRPLPRSPFWNPILHAIAVIAPEVPNVDPFASPTQIACFTAFFGVNACVSLLCVSSLYR